MPLVRVEETMDVPIQALFDVLSDHARYDRFPGVKSSELIQQGTDHKNGVGAVRRIGLGAAVLEEEILEYDPPNAFSYRITRVKPLPVRHRMGRVELESLGPNQTKIVWWSDFEVALPIVGGFLSKQLAGQFTRGFKGTIRAAAKLAAA